MITIIKYYIDHISYTFNKNLIESIDSSECISILSTPSTNLANLSKLQCARKTRELST